MNDDLRTSEPVRIPDVEDVDHEGSGKEVVEVAHLARSSTNSADSYGGRRRRDGVLRHLANTSPPEPGWLGNPYVMDGDSREERQRAIAAYVHHFLDAVQDSEFRTAVESLRGQTVGCWCRGLTQERTPDNWCHLDVVNAWLDGDMSDVWTYLRRDL